VSVVDDLARLGAATVYEASGRQGLVDADLIQVVPGSRACGPARIARCAQDDNLMVHAAMAALQPGEVLVLTMPGWVDRAVETLLRNVASLALGPATTSSTLPL